MQISHCIRHAGLADLVVLGLHGYQWLDLQAKHGCHINVGNYYFFLQGLLLAQGSEFDREQKFSNPRCLFLVCDCAISLGSDLCG